MRGDLSRDTFKPARHYSSVRLQQGRVITDADWNEQADITRRRIEREAADVIGTCGAPEAAAGFSVSAATQAFGAFAAADDAWVVGEDGVIVSTVDGGATWFVADRHTTAALRAVHFASSTTGWAVGDAGAILKTVDGGMSWTPQSSDSSVSLRSVFALDATRAWAVGDGGTLRRTLDGGATWLPETVGSGRLHAVRFVDPARGWVVGQAGQIFSTDDGGDTWTARESGTHAHLRALHFADALTGWAAGENGTILKTADGGVTWTPQATGVTERLRSIAFIGSDVGWAAGDEGVALRTENGGATWLREDLGTRTTLRGVALASNSLGWIVGDDSAAVRVASLPASVSLEKLPGASISLGPGRLYVDGVLCEIEERTSLYAQPDGGLAVPLSAGTHLLCLDVWERYVSHLEDPAIREVALNGPDTAGRSKTVWQVLALPLGSASPPSTCLSELADLNALAEPSRARLRARAEPSQIPNSVCEIGASAGFRRLENQLYRVEVHAGAPVPSFKWSRENGSVAYAVVSVAVDPANVETIITLASRGLDENLDLGIDDWIEIVDDRAALDQGAGSLFKYVRNGNDLREIVVEGLVPATIGRDPERHPLVRRWEQKPATGNAGSLPIEEGKWIDLEEGVQVWFSSGGTYRPGDYWLIPARTVTGDVEWPRDEHDEPLARRPDGVAHHYCRLALVEVDSVGTVTVLSDCREIFPPLTAFTQLLYVSGDGQDGIPGIALPQPLRVRVARGSHPVVGARVLFSVEAGGGHVAGLPPGVPLEVTTGSDGVAQCEWVLDPDLAPAKSYQRVRATLLDAASQDVDGQAVVFCATGTASLQYVGGDGQEGAAGQQLTYPLQVRVSNGQRPVAGARVGFLVTAGGGQVVGTNPVTTGADGLASALWQLGAAGNQQVDAQLLDASNTAIQHTTFSASFPISGTTGTGCDVTIGEKGDFKEITTDLLKMLLEKFKGRVCLCFLPGDHVINGLEVDAGGIGDGDARVSLHSCGAARIRLTKPAILEGFALFEIANLNLNAGANCGFAFRKCTDVRVLSVIGHADASTEFPLLRFADVRSVTIERCRLATKLSGPAAAVVFDDAEAVARLIDTDVEGVVSFYGFPTPAPQLLDRGRLKQRMAGHTALQPSRGRLYISTCSITRIAIGREKAAELEQFIHNGTDILTALFESAALQSTVLSEMQQILLCQTLTLTACSFVGTPQHGVPYGSFVMEHCTAVGNLTLHPVGDFAMLELFTRPRRLQEAANLVAIFS